MSTTVIPGVGVSNLSAHHAAPPPSTLTASCGLALPPPPPTPGIVSSSNASRPFLATGAAEGVNAIVEQAALMPTTADGAVVVVGGGGGGNSGGRLSGVKCVVEASAPDALPDHIRVLVVDDSPINRTLMRRMLKSRQVAPSWEVEDAENGARAFLCPQTRDRGNEHST